MFLYLCCDFERSYKCAYNESQIYVYIQVHFVVFSQDVVAAKTLPLPGYFVTSVTTGESANCEFIIKIFHSGQKKIWYLQAESADQMKR